MDVPTAAPSTALRLNRGSLSRLPTHVSTPSYDVRDLRPGVVHLGTGCFHRAHQAVYLDAIAEQGISRDWAVVGSSLRSGRLAQPLALQDGLYTVTTAGATPSTRVVGIQQRYLAVPETGAAPLVQALADPRTRMVTMTITAPSYARAGAAAAEPTFALLADALDLRRRAGAPPLTVLSCDNLPANGPMTRDRVLAAASRRDATLARWIERHVAFPSSMVDRITPVLEDEQRRRLCRTMGVQDRIPVVTEQFSQWVVEDAFAGDRPPLEEVGVQLVPDVRPYVDMKMRLLNGSHLALGFVGSRAGHRTTDAAMRDPRVAGLVTEMMRDEVSPLLDPLPGIDLAAYRATLVARLGDESMADPLSRLCRRGSVRMDNYVLPSLRAAVRAGRPHRALTTVVAAWIDHLRRHTGGLDDLEDPMARVLVPLARRAVVDVRPFLDVAPGFEDLRASTLFVSALQRALTPMEDHDRAAS